MIRLRSYRAFARGLWLNPVGYGVVNLCLLSVNGAPAMAYADASAKWLLAAVVFVVLLKGLEWLGRWCRFVESTLQPESVGRLALGFAIGAALRPAVIGLIDAAILSGRPNAPAAVPIAAILSALAVAAIAFGAAWMLASLWLWLRPQADRDDRFDLDWLKSQSRH